MGQPPVNTQPGSKPDPKDDLKSLPLPEVEKKLGSSPDGLTQANVAEVRNPLEYLRTCFDWCRMLRTADA
jgi:leucyl-tRNA synthetase